ncbi:MAG: 23S rRNA methyltransferase [Dactylosporangium sp.]|nr:23S rRNA methyltransferase [Dactylosporangium sp.]
MNARDPQLDAEAIAALRCPVCHQPLDVDRRSLCCPVGHRFDLARQGHVDLSRGRVTHQGDTAEMVTARAVLLAAGHLASVSDALAGAVARDAAGLVVDVGAGPGHHLAKILDARSGLCGLAVDVSQAALRKAARAHRRAVAVRADVWRALPIATASARVVLDVFAPRAPREFHRVLRADGQLIVATPTRAHLREIAEPLGLIAIDPQKEQRLSSTLTPLFAPSEIRERTAVVRLSHEEIRTLVLMGPSARHLAPETLSTRLARLPRQVDVTVSVSIGIWLPRGDDGGDGPG